jgi:hypothetical protein
MPGGYHQPIAYCNKRVVPITNKGATFVQCAIPLKKVKFKVKNHEAINSYKNYQRFISE